MAFQDPNKPVIGRFFATATSGRRWEITSTPGNTIDGYSGIPTETEPGHIIVDGNNSGPTPIAFVRLQPPKLSGSLYNNNHFTMWNGTGVDAFFEFHTPRIDITDPDGGFGLSINTANMTVQRGDFRSPTQVTTYFNGWGPGAGSRGAYFYLDTAGICHLMGRVDAGVVGSNILVLPPACRPIEQMQFAISNNGAYGQFRADVGGGVVLTTGTNVAVSLNGVSFPVASLG